MDGKTLVSREQKEWRDIIESHDGLLVYVEQHPFPRIHFRHFYIQLAQDQHTRKPVKNEGKFWQTQTSVQNIIQVRKSKGKGEQDRGKCKSTTTDKDSSYTH